MKPEPGNVRSLAAAVLDRILTSRVPADGPLRWASAGLEPRDGRLLREIVLGCLRWLRRLDAVIESASARPLTKIDAAILAPLRVGVFQLLYLDRVPAHAAVDQAVREVRRRTHRGGAGFANAVLRRVAAAADLARWPVDEADPLRRLAIETSHPDFLVARWWNQFGEIETRRLAQANNRRKPRQLLVFGSRGGRATAAQALSREGVTTIESDLAPFGLVVQEGDPEATESFAGGYLYLQDVASQAAALVPAPSPAERILDAAAAPGGKSFSLLAAEESVRIVAADRDPARLCTLERERRRLRLPMQLVAADALRAPWGCTFDRVVLDLPCSGSGTLRKHPELKWRISQDEIERLGRQAERWVDAASQWVRPRGGLLVLSTCSLEPEENGHVAESLRRQRPEFDPLPLESRLAAGLDRGIVGPGAWQILPGDGHDGFTVHVLRRG